MFLEYGMKGRMKPLGDTAPIVCPGCKQETRLHIMQAYDHFFLFSVPVKEVDKLFYAACPQCASVFRVRQSQGEAYAKGSADAITSDSLFPANEEEPANE